MPQTQFTTTPTVCFTKNCFWGGIGFSENPQEILFYFSPWKSEPNSARNDEGTHKNLSCVLMDLTLKSAADFMDNHKHFLDG